MRYSPSVWTEIKTSFTKLNLFLIRQHHATGLYSHGFIGLSRRFLLILATAVIWLLLIGVSIGMPVLAATSCINIKRIDINESDLLDDQAKQEMLRPYYGQCINGDRLKALTADISKFYFDRGYVTTRPYLKEQDITDGSIEIDVLVGITESIVYKDSRQSDGRITTAFASQKGDSLNLRDIETSLEMIERPPSVQAQFEVTPGSVQGTSVVEIAVKEALPYRLQIGSSYERGRESRHPNYTVDAAVDNVFNINDILRFRYNSSDIRRLEQNSEGAELNYSFPIGSYLIEIEASQPTYTQVVAGLNDEYLSEGETKGTRLRVSKVLSRNQTNKWTLALSLYHKNTKSYFEKSLIEVSSYKTTLAQMDLSHAWLQSWGQLHTTLGYYKGLDWFDARDDDYFSPGDSATSEARLLFEKYSLDSTVIYPIGTNYQLSSNLHIQHTSDDLYDNDKLSVGSHYTVRGYRNSLSGSNGWYFKNDITRNFPVADPDALLRSRSVFAGLDFGEVRCENGSKRGCGTISGVATGMTLATSSVTARLALAYPLKEVGDNFEKHTTVKFDLYWSIL